MNRFLLSLFICLSLVASTAALARPKRVVLGVYLPTSMNDGNERFALSEKLGAQLEERLGVPVTVKNFGRANDFSAAIKSLDLAIVDGWAAVQMLSDRKVLAGATLEGDLSHRWAIVSKQKGAVKDLEGKRLAIPGGLKSLDSKFVTNVIFGGDVSADHHFKILKVPNIESGLAMLESKKADAALVPLFHVEPGNHVLYRSQRTPTVVAVHLKGDFDEHLAALLKMEGSAPLDRFVAMKEGSLTGLARLTSRGPPARHPVIAPAPVLRPDPTALVDVEKLGLVLPAFLEFMETSNDRPDD